MSPRVPGTYSTPRSRTSAIPEDAEIASPCKTCGRLMVFPPGWFAQTFAQMRSDGWLA